MSKIITKPRYSYSALEKAKCGERYRLSKETPQKELTFNLAAGSMLDTAFNAYYENNAHLVESHEERMEYAKAALQLYLDEHQEYFTIPWSAKAGDPRSSPENYIHWLFDGGALGLVCRHDRGPVKVQLKVELELPKYSIIGYIDCLELNTNTIVDVKSVTGWGTTTPLQYALRSQIPLYRMLLRDSEKMQCSGRYELLMCRKKPTYVAIPDPDLDFLQDKLIADFDAHHKMVSTQSFCKNPDHCLDWNRPCPYMKLCWPQLASLLPETTMQPTTT